MIMQFQIASLAVFLIVSLMWLLPNKTKSYESRFFGIMLIFVAVSLFTGILFSCFNLGLIEVEHTTTKTIAKFNNAFIMLLLYIEIMYLFSKLVSENKHKFYLFPFSSVPLFEMLVLLIVDLEIRQGTNKAALGAEPSVMYVLAFIDVLAIVAMIVLLRNRFSKWFRFITSVIASIIFIGIILQYLTEIDGILQLCIIDSIALAFITLENPINKIDNNYDCFKSTYITASIDRYYSNRINGFATFIGMHCDFSNATAEEQLTILRKKIIEELKTVPELEIFLSPERDILVLCDSPKLFDDFILDIDEVVQDAKIGLSLADNIKTVLVIAPNILATNSGDALYRHLSIARSDALGGYDKHSIVYIDENAITSVEAEEKTREIIIEALNNDKIEVFYQPIYSSADERFTGAEALARIRMTDNSILMPKYFIKTAENTGLIMEIGYKVFEKVCQMLKDPSTGELEIDKIDINLSLIQCENQDLAYNLIEIAKKYEINPSIINFDITEANFASVYENLTKNLEKLHKFGFSLSLDDFGTGESNLNYLINIPISSVKIDRHIIWDYFDNTRIRATVGHLNKLCHKLGMKVTATGVEKIGQLEEMSKQGIDYIQGYYFFKPMPLDEYLQFLKPNAFEMDETKKKILKSSLQNRTINKLSQ